MTEFRINVSVDNNKLVRVAERVRKVGAGMEAARGPATIAMAERAREQTIQNLQEGKSGETWRSPLIPSHWIQYSKPAGVNGGIPASQHGGLVASIVVRPTGKGNANLVAGEGLPRRYAYWLELGFTTAITGKDRKLPFLRPSVAQVTKEFPAICAAICRQHIQ